MKKLFLNLKNKKNKAFTIVELVIVIAVIGILASVLIPTFSNIIERANQSEALQCARNDWMEVAYLYPGGYDGYIYYKETVNGWYYDATNNCAKYNYQDKYTITYNGEEFVVNAWDGTSAANITISESGSGTVADYSKF